MAQHVRRHHAELQFDVHERLRRGRALAMATPRSRREKSHVFVGGRAVSAATAAQFAMPANHAGDNECDCGQKDDESYIFDLYEGPWCYCQEPAVSAPRFAYFNPPASRGPPEQINLIVGFVTVEKSYPNASAPLPAPVAEFGAVGGARRVLRFIGFNKISHENITASS